MRFLIFASVFFSLQLLGAESKFDWQQFHTRLDQECVASDGKPDSVCAAHVLVDAMKKASHLGHSGPQTTCADLKCYCDNDAKLFCTAGAAGAETVIGGTSPYIGSNSRCRDYQKIVKKQCRVCDNDNWLWVVNLQEQTFMKQAYLGSMSRCKAQAEGD